MKHNKILSAILAAVVMGTSMTMGAWLRRTYEI